MLGKENVNSIHKRSTIKYSLFYSRFHILINLIRTGNSISIVDYELHKGCLNDDLKIANEEKERNKSKYPIIRDKLSQVMV